MSRKRAVPAKCRYLDGSMVIFIDSILSNSNTSCTPLGCDDLVMWSSCITTLIADLLRVEVPNLKLDKRHIADTAPLFAVRCMWYVYR